MGFEEEQSDGSSLHFDGEILQVNNVGLITDYHYGVSHSDVSEEILIGFLIGLAIGAGYTFYLINNPTSPLETIQLNEADDVSIVVILPIIIFL